MSKNGKAATPTLSLYKWKKLGREALLNALRLHRDAILLFNANSFPSAFQLSVLSLEEFAKAKWVEHYYWSSIANCEFPDAEFEQNWLKLLYIHSDKQYAFIARDMFEYQPPLVEFIKSGELERRKQKAVYVGLERDRKTVNVKNRISLPSSITRKEVKKMISWVNAEFIFIHKALTFYEHYFGISEMDEVMLLPSTNVIFEWPYKSRVRSTKHRLAHIALRKGEYIEAEHRHQSKLASDIS
ncbi:AbiV family abortive infection protein [Burkholderia ubonensis]|uniref:AbiV family abortive infection protein n=1 Tax=Burkholderia ubonensis TaxID=101571 RepID=UPI000B224F3F|nr:AbiV family abortive infection protein [Burkholderia ubonensis]